MRRRIIRGHIDPLKYLTFFRDFDGYVAAFLPHLTYYEFKMVAQIGPGGEES
jgi:hypothetical protein